METRGSILLAVLAACLAVSQSISIKRDLPPLETLDPLPQYCPSVVGVCIEPNLDSFEDEFDTEEDAIAFLGNSTGLQELADAAQAAADCIDEKVAEPDSCYGASENQPGYLEVTVVANYLNTPGNIDIVVSASSSSCLTNRNDTRLLGMGASQCYITFMQNLMAKKNVCKELAKLKTCTVGVAADVCGEAAGQFLQSAWTFIAQSQTNPSDLFGVPEEIGDIFLSCTQQVSLAQQMVKRALERLRK